MSYEKEMLELAEKFEARSIMLIVIGGNRGTKLGMALNPIDLEGTVKVLESLLSQLKNRDSAVWESFRTGGKEIKL